MKKITPEQIEVYFNDQVGVQNFIMSVRKMLFEMSYDILYRQDVDGAVSFQDTYYYLTQLCEAIDPIFENKK